MNMDDTVKYINEELEKGRSFKSIESELGFNDRVLYKRLTRKGYKRSEDGYKTFILVDKDGAAGAHEAKVNNKPSRSKESSALTNEELEKLKNLLNRYDDIMYMLDDDSKCNATHTHDIYNTDNIQILQTNNTKQRMFRVDVDVLDRWNSFCEEYKHIKVQSLISSALLEYIEKYSK